MDQSNMLFGVGAAMPPTTCEALDELDQIMGHNSDGSFPPYGTDMQRRPPLSRIAAVSSFRQGWPFMSSPTQPQPIDDIILVGKEVPLESGGGWRCHGLGGECFEQFAQIATLKEHFQTRHMPFDESNPPFMYRCTACEMLNDLPDICYQCQPTPPLEREYYGRRRADPDPSPFITLRVDNGDRPSSFTQQQSFDTQFHYHNNISSYPGFGGGYSSAGSGYGGGQGGNYERVDAAPEIEANPGAEDCDRWVASSQLAGKETQPEEHKTPTQSTGDHLVRVVMMFVTVFLMVWLEHLVLLHCALGRSPADRISSFLRVVSHYALLLAVSVVIVAAVAVLGVAFSVIHAALSRQTEMRATNGGSNRASDSCWTVEVRVNDGRCLLSHVGNLPTRGARSNLLGSSVR
jgi:hypothetical protein